jgi:hypothetical protein
MTNVRMCISIDELLPNAQQQFGRKPWKPQTSTLVMLFHKILYEL